MNPIKVSVHIVTYNSSEDIIECLEAVACQQYPVLRIIVVDNASSDDSAARVKEWHAQGETEGRPLPALLVVENSANAGFASAHNQAIAASDADYMLVLNPDVTLAPDYVSRLVARMEAEPAIGSATGKLLRKADSGVVDSTGLWMNRARRAFDRGADEPAERWTASGEVFGVSGAAAMYSRRMIEDIAIFGEFFDGDFFAYKEDVDVAWRARLLGWRAYYDADARGYHERGWKTSGRSGKSLFIRRISYINRYKMLFKNEPARSLIPTLLYALPYEAAATGYMLVREPALLKAWGSFFGQRKNLRRKRKALQEKMRTR